MIWLVILFLTYIKRKVIIRKIKILKLKYSGKFLKKDVEDLLDIKCNQKKIDDKFIKELENEYFR